MPQEISSPRAPVSAQTRNVAQERAQFQALKKSLSHITSWELAGASWDEGLIMKFTENFSDEKAKVFLRVIS